MQKSCCCLNLQRKRGKKILSQIQNTMFFLAHLPSRPKGCGREIYPGIQQILTLIQQKLFGSFQTEIPFLHINHESSASTHRPHAGLMPRDESSVLVLFQTMVSYGIKQLIVTGRGIHLLINPPLPSVTGSQMAPRHPPNHSPV